MIVQENFSVWVGDQLRSWCNTLPEAKVYALFAKRRGHDGVYVFMHRWENTNGKLSETERIAQELQIGNAAPI